MYINTHTNTDIGIGTSGIVAYNTDTDEYWYW